MVSLKKGDSNMNKKRKTELNQISEELEILFNRLENIYDQEQDAYDSMPENLQGSEKGMESEEAIDTIDEIKEHIQDAIDMLSEIV